MKKPLINPLFSSTYIANDRRVGRRKALTWFNLVAFGFFLGLLAGHLMFRR